MTKQQKLDSLKTKLSRDSAWIFRYKKVRPLFAIDQRNSFIRKYRVKISGFQLGVRLKERHQLGMGFYTVSPDIKKDSAAMRVNDSTYRRLKMGYATFFWEYELLHKKRWELGFPIEFGFGHYEINLVNTKPVKPDPTKPPPPPPPQGGFVSLGTAVDVTYNIWSWAGVNAMLGYRFVSEKDPKLNFNGAFYSVGLQISLGQIIRISRYKIKRHSYKKHVKEINQGAG